MRLTDAKQTVFLQGLERERLVLKPNHIHGYQPVFQGVSQRETAPKAWHCGLTLLPGGPLSKQKKIRGR